MIKLKKIIREYSTKIRSNEISIDDAKQLLSTVNNIKNFEGHYIYRGNSSLKQGLIYLVKPSNFERISRNTTNENTLLMDNLPSWKDYPKRSKSIICSSDKAVGEAYSGYLNSPHIVIPISKGAKVGICPERDVWDSFNFSNIEYIHVEESNDIFIDLRKDFIGINESFKTWEDLLELFKVIDDNKSELIKTVDRGGDTFAIMIKTLYWYQKYVSGNDSLINVINKEFSPTVHNFELIQDYSMEYNKISNSENQELWTDADCVLIPYKALKEIT